jgi:phage terminase Nu1 subunit (DNA packaging protein)
MATEKLTIHEAAVRLGITDRQVTNLLADGLPHVGAGNKRRILWPEARRWRDDQLRAEGARRVRPSSADEADARKKAAEAQLKELELAERRGELVRLDVAERWLVEAFGRVASKLKSLPGSVAMQVVGQTLPERQRQAQALVDEVMAELARADDVPVIEDEVEEGEDT